jgi:hypothetical protein
MPADSLLGVLLVIALGALWFGPIQWVVTDIARQYAFECRDALFDLAADGRISFKSDEYRTVRTAIEQIIRFAHDATLLRVLMGIVVARRRGTGAHSILTKTIDGIADEDLRNRVRELALRASLAIGISIVARSPIALFGLFVFVLGRAVLHGHFRIQAVLRDVKRRISERVQLEAEHGAIAAG